MELLTIVIHTARTFILADVMKCMRETDRRYILPLQKLVLLAFLLRWLVGVLTAVAVIKTIWFIGLFPRLKIFLILPRKYASTLLCYLIYIFLVIIVFAGFFFFLRHSDNRQFSTLSNSIFTLVLYVSRQFKPYDMTGLHPSFGVVVSAIYTLIVRVLFMNCLVALVLRIYKREVSVAVVGLRSSRVLGQSIRWLAKILGLKFTLFKHKRMANRGGVGDPQLDVRPSVDAAKPSSGQSVGGEQNDGLV